MSPPAARPARKTIVAGVDGSAASLAALRFACERHPSAAVLEAAAADLHAVGSRGRGGLAGLALGSVNRECAQHAPCPVTIVRGRAAA